MLDKVYFYGNDGVAQKAYIASTTSTAVELITLPGDIYPDISSNLALIQAYPKKFFSVLGNTLYFDGVSAADPNIRGIYEVNPSNKTGYLVQSEQGGVYLLEKFGRNILTYFKDGAGDKAYYILEDR